MYLAEMTSLGGERVKMQVAIPVADGKYPVQIYYNGYGAKPWNWPLMPIRTLLK